MNAIFPPHRTQDCPAAKFAAFSLTELLVVIAILGMLTGALAPAVNSVGRAALLTGEGNRIAAMAELARQKALANNAVTALVMDSQAGANNEAQCAFSIWQLGANDSNAPEWRQIARKETLKDGIEVDANLVETENTSTAVASLPADRKWVFLPTGNLLGTKSGLLSLRQKGSENTYTISLLNATGRTKVTRN